MCARCKATYRKFQGSSLEDMEAACANSKRKLEAAYLGPRAVTGCTSIKVGVPRGRRERDSEPTVKEWEQRKIRTTGEIEIPSGEWWLRKCAVGLTETGRKAELGRQARRLAGHEIEEAM